MCAEYTIRKSSREIVAELGAVSQVSPEEFWDHHVRLYGSAPVILKKNGVTVIEEMRFSLKPPGGRIPFTANTRLDDWDDRKNQPVFVYQRPTWRDAFIHHRCIVPMTEFLEPVYVGENAGKMLAFSPPNGALLWIAGIYGESVDVKTGELYTGFSLLTDFAVPTVREAGHHRTVIMLSAQNARRWISETEITGPQGVRFLLKNKIEPELTFSAAREMKNWKARVAKAQAKDEEEERIRPLVEKARLVLEAGTGEA